MTHSTLDPAAATAVSIAALVANVAAIIYIAYRAKKLGRNPYKQDVLRHQRWRRLPPAAPRWITHTPSNVFIPSTFGCRQT